MNHRIRLIAAVVVLFSFLFLVIPDNPQAQRIPYGTFPSWGEGLPPVIDKEDEPFDWYRYPLCIIGVNGGPEETMITPEGINAPTRMGWRPGDTCCPHCEHAGKLVTLLRDMLVREEENVLHIASVLSPAWLKEGSIIKFLNGATFFGKMSFTLKISGKGFSLNLEPPRRNPPRKIVIHIPENVVIKEVKRDGEIWKNFTRQEKKVPSETKNIKVEWEKSNDAPALSFKRTVEEYKESYKNLISQ